MSRFCIRIDSMSWNISGFSSYFIKNDGFLTVFFLCCRFNLIYCNFLCIAASSICLVHIRQAFASADLAGLCIRLEIKERLHICARFSTNMHPRSTLGSWNCEGRPLVCPWYSGQLACTSTNSTVILATFKHLGIDLHLCKYLKWLDQYDLL